MNRGTWITSLSLDQIRTSKTKTVWNTYVVLSGWYDNMWDVCEQQVGGVYLSSCCPPAWLCVWRLMCRRQPGRQRRRARAGWCHSRPVCRCCPGCQCSDGSRRAAGPGRPAQCCRRGRGQSRNRMKRGDRGRHGSLWISAAFMLFSAEWTHSTGMNFARARKLPKYPAAACRRTAGWEGLCRTFQRWSRKASANAWKTEKIYIDDVIFKKNMYRNSSEVDLELGCFHRIMGRCNAQCSLSELGQWDKQVFRRHTTLCAHWCGKPVFWPYHNY